MSTLSEVMNTLYHAGKDNMSPRELRNIGISLCESAEQRGIHMRDVVNGIAGLVQNDGSLKPAQRTRDFQTAEDVFSLLLTLANEFDSLSGMIAVGHDAILTGDWRTHQDELVEAMKSAGVGIVQKGANHEPA